MKPMKIIYDESGNTLYVRFGDEKEAYCSESDVGKEVVFSRAADGSVIGFEILNFLPEGTTLDQTSIPIETEIVRAL